MITFAKSFLLLFPLSFVSASLAQTQLPEPVAKKIPHEMTIHGDKRIDNYFWMKDKKNPVVIKYLKAENAYTAQMTKETKPLQESLYKEMRGRIKEADKSYPYKQDNYTYFSETLAGKEYAIFKRQKIGSTKIETMLDVNQLAKGKAFIRVGGPQLAPSEQMIAYPVDYKGDRVFTIYFKDLKNNKTLKNKIEEVDGSLAWDETGKYLFYGKQDPQTLRTNRIFRYDMEKKKSELIYEEKDEKFEVTVYKTLSKKFIIIYSASTLSSESRFIASDKPFDAFTVFLPRENELEYSVDDGGDRFYVRTNWLAKNFRLVEVPYGVTTKDKWKDILPHRENVFLEDVKTFKNYIAINERENGLQKLNVVDRSNNKNESISFPDPAYMVNLGANEDFATDKIRYDYESMTRPDSVYEYDTSLKTSKLLKQKEVPGYNPEQYVSERIFATASDGTKTPVSLVYKQGLKKDASSPMIVYGYGSYGMSSDPYFSNAVVSLIDRGFVYAIAHVRGGSEMGRPWYEHGKFLEKKNTFTDFIAVTEFLIKEKYADPKRVYANGGSAGGLLMGAVLNLRPDLYDGVLAEVPFVDVVTTMLDSTIPLTTGEYEEWGNPNDARYYRYMKSYSPYDNVSAQAYPNILVTTGLNDSQVGYWEPTKWVAKMRDMRTDKSKQLLLKIEMEVGHGGKSGRFEYLRQTAFEYSFLINLAEKKK
jgi:oligopeptidase B